MERIGLRSANTAQTFSAVTSSAVEARRFVHRDPSMQSGKALEGQDVRSFYNLDVFKSSELPDVPVFFEPMRG